MSSIILGWAGFLFTLPLFLAPLQPMASIVEASSVGSFSALPYLVGVLNCASWVVYALPSITPGRTQPLVTNAAGLVFEIAYVLTFVRYEQRRRRARLCCLLAGALLLPVALGVASTSYAARLRIPHWPDRAASSASTVMGFCCVLCNTAMYAAPLSVMAMVVRTRSVEFMPLALTLGGGVCAGFWTAYGLVKPVDLFIIVPNGAGVVLTLAQLGVFGRYCGRSSVPTAPREPLVSAGADLEGALLDGGSTSDDTSAHASEYVCPRTVPVPKRAATHPFPVEAPPVEEDGEVFDSPSSVDGKHADDVLAGRPRGA